MTEWKKRREEFVNQFSTEFGESEALSMFRLIKDHFSTQEVLNEDQLNIRYQEVLDELTDLKPIQYVLGYAWFYNLKIKVNEHVLIPRPETEELVQLLINDVEDKALNIIDIGTGSGCIALGIKSVLSNTNVLGVDISKHALKVAQNNAIDLNLDVSFKHLDITSNNGINADCIYDVVVSNPPYIDLQEENDLEPYVTENEPMIALFTPENDALYYYRAILEFCRSYLTERGKLFLELSEYKADAVYQLVKSTEIFDQIELVLDMQRKPRFLKAKKE